MGSFSPAADRPQSVADQPQLRLRPRSMALGDGTGRIRRPI